MKKRTKEEILQDANRILKTAEISQSFKEITEITGLTKDQIKYSLDKSGRLEEVKKKIAKNKARRSKKIVIDTSVSSNKDIIGKLENSIKNKKTFIILTLINQELKKLSGLNDFPGRNARKIMNMAIENPDNFQVVSLEKYPWESVDEKLMKFAMKNNVILWTSDKELYLNAKANDVECVYFKSQYTNSATTGHYNGMNTLFNTRVENGKLLFDMDNLPNNKYVELIKDSYVYCSGKHELSYGDEVFVAKRKRGCILIEHFKVISNKPKANVRLVYYYKIRRPRDTKKLENDYVVFARDAMRKLDNKNKIF